MFVISRSEKDQKYLIKEPRKARKTMIKGGILVSEQDLRESLVLVGLKFPKESIRSMNIKSTEGNMRLKSHSMVLREENPVKIEEKGF